MGKAYKIIIKIITFWIPLKSIRKQLRNKLLDIYQNINKEFFNEIILKYKELQIQKDNIQTIVIGSSHGAGGFVSRNYSESCFNLACASQDLYYSYQIYKYCRKEIKNLKKIYLFFSIFSPGFELQKTKEKQRCAFYKYLFDIPYKYEPDNELKKCYKQASKYYKNFSSTISTNGYIEQKNFLDNSYPVEKRVYTHLRENSRKNDQMDYLQKIIDECNDNNISFTIIIPPVRKDYYKLLPDLSLLFDDLYKLKNTPEILFFIENNSFSDEDFGDYDHLNYNGAVKLTNLIKDKVGIR